MARLKEVSTPELRDRLGAYRDEPEETVLYDLHVHEIELELQNRELRESQQQVENSRDRYAKLYDFAPIGYAKLDRHGLIKGINLTGSDMFRLPRSHIVGRPMASFLDHPCRREWLNHIGSWRTRNHTVGEFKLRYGSGTVLPVQMVTVNLGPDIGSEGDEDVFLTAIIDLSDRKRAEDALKRSHDELEERVKQRTADLEAANSALQVEVGRRRQLEDELRQRAEELTALNARKDEFLAMLSHELRNPLAALRIGFELMKRQLSSTVDHHTAALHQMMDRQFKQLVRLTDDLLDTSRISKGKIRLQLELVDIRAGIEDALCTVHNLMDERRHELSVELPRQPLRIRGDSARIHQITQNLLLNAIKFTEPGGQIRVQLTEKDRQAVLRIADNGQGISAELLPHVFEPFTQGDNTLDRAKGGLGLGLALVDRLVKLHGGRVEAFSAGPGKGSEFAVRFPLASAPVEPESFLLPGEPASALTARGHRIMLVDDNVDFTETASALLKMWGHEVRTANDGPAAVKLARKAAPALVFIDVGLPGMDGFAVAAALRKQPESESAFLVMLSGYGGKEYRERAAAAGVDDYLIKPVTPEALQAFLEHWEQAVAESAALGCAKDRGATR